MKIRPEHETAARRLVALLRNESGIARVRASAVKETMYPPGTMARGQANETAALWRTADSQLRKLAATIENAAGYLD